MSEPDEATSAATVEVAAEKLAEMIEAALVDGDVINRPACCRIGDPDDESWAPTPGTIQVDGTIDCRLMVEGLAATRRDALEEAAALAESVEWQELGLAAAIRALKDTPGIMEQIDLTGGFSLYVRCCQRCSTKRELA